MKVYVVIIDDTHCDIDVEVFASAAEAVFHARHIAIDNAYDPADIEEEDIKGWLYFARYSSESSVWVLEKEVVD